MCCRYLLLREHLNKLLEQFGVRGGSELASRYNIAPGTKIPALRLRPRAEANAAAPHELARLRWGLVPAWSKDATLGVGLVNARAESLDEKPSFREAFRARRCLIPASGFYEWKAVGKKRQPWLFQLRDEQPFFLAGLWESWIAPDGVAHETCAVVTTGPNQLMKPIHDRLPAIVPVEQGRQWLDSVVGSERLVADFLRPFSVEQMIVRPVSSRVNSVANDDVSCLTGAEPSADSGADQLAWDL
jgi:putative SOS response-associated peptidase YedK